MQATSVARLSSARRSSQPPRRYTLEDWLNIPEEQRCELIDGKLIYQAMPGPIHGRVQKRIGLLTDPYDREDVEDPQSPHGWWISIEVDMNLRGFGCRPDLVGWRRDRHPKLPEPDERGLVTAVPDWICEVLSPSTAHIDLGAKRRNYFESGVEHYWVADPQNKTLTVFRRSHEDYIVALVAGRGERTHIEPFQLIEISVNRLFGDDNEDALTQSEDANASL